MGACQECSPKSICRASRAKCGSPPKSPSECSLAPATRGGFHRQSSPSGTGCHKRSESHSVSPGDRSRMCNPRSADPEHCGPPASRFRTTTPFRGAWLGGDCRRSSETHPRWERRSEDSARTATGRRSSSPAPQTWDRSASAALAALAQPDRAAFPAQPRSAAHRQASCSIERTTDAKPAPGRSRDKSTPARRPLDRARRETGN